MSTCKQSREGDENVCACGLRWDVGEEDPHFDNAVYELRVQLLKAAAFSKRSVNDCLVELVTDCLTCETDESHHVYGPDFIKKFDAGCLAKVRP